jgi:tetratricopeptide (TPR) repeat protein
MNRKKFIIIFIILGLAVLLGVSSFYYQSKDGSVNYLIKGVPYFGFYNHSFDADLSIASAIADVFGYWGDERFNLMDLAKKFPASKFNQQILLELPNFFQDNGYEVYSGKAETGEELKEIKKFVNSKNKIPVIVFQKNSLNPNRISFGLRVVIGVFDREKKVIVHDYIFGNNYEISYQDFQKLFQSEPKFILAVWPSAELAGKIKGPDANPQSYPERTVIMDKIGKLLETGSDAYMFYSRNSFAIASRLFEKILESPDAVYFLPAHRVYLYNLLAFSQFFLYQKDPQKLDDVIKLINEKILPLNYDLSQPYNGWTEQLEYFKNYNFSTDKSPMPFYILGQIYLAKGNKELAKKNFKEALRIYPDYSWAKEAIERLK